jgi:hypothetical protein
MHTLTCSGPGGPGISARWTSSAKTGVGTSLSHGSRVWFTQGHGTFNEIHYPRTERGCVRDKGLTVTDGVDFFSEEKPSDDSEVHWLADTLQTVQRYLVERTGCRRVVWRFDHIIRSMPPGHTLRFETLAPAIVRRTSDEWATARDAPTKDVGLAIHIADLAAGALPVGGQIMFTFYRAGAGRWEGTEFVVRVGPLSPMRPDRPEGTDANEASLV